MTSASFGAALAALAFATSATAADFDARKPKDVLAVVTSNGASGQLKVGTDGKPYIDAKAGKVFFDVDFYDCDDAKALCTTLNFYGSWTSKAITLDQINRWNRWTLWCPAYLNKDGAPNVWSVAAVTKGLSREDFTGDVDTWMDCLRDFDDFVAHPEEVLRQKEAPAAKPAAPGSTTS